MTRTIPNRIRAARKRWHLSQDELRFLSGYHSHDPISRYERYVTTPRLDFVLACEVIFGTPPRELLPGVFDKIEDNVMARAANLYRRLDGVPGRAATEKRRLLLAMVRRARSSSHQPS